LEGTTFSPSHYATEDNSYNADGQLTGVSITGIDSGASNAYSYDSDSQLTGSSGTSNITYGYDANGNHDTIGYTTGAGNEMTHSPGVTYTYDNDGNTITATTSSRTTTYTYDFESRLTNVEIDRTMSATYTYDALGRRIGIDDGGTQTWTAFNGKTADDNPYADFTASGSLQTRYLDGLAVDELFARTSASGITAWYLRDNVGSFYADVTTTMVLDAVIYDPYGNIVTETNASEGDRFKFAGMEYDSVTGLYYDHARYYDAAIGRFVSQDPMEFAAGDTNLYRYVANEPTTLRDPSGKTLGAAMALGGTFAVADGPFPIGDAIGIAVVLTALAHDVYFYYAVRPIGLPIIGPPGSSGVIDHGNGTGQIRDYGPDGRAFRDYDFGHDHGYGDPHGHEWDWTGPKPVRGKGFTIK
jgi:RHS repeat-associated protein